MFNMDIVRLQNLSKSFGDNLALDNISLQVEEGEIYGLLGPNGAGKSTLINILSSLLKKSSGTIEIFNRNLAKEVSYIRENIGVVPQDIAIYEDLTAYENVTFFGSLYGLKGTELKNNAKEALEFVGLEGKYKNFPNTFSGGMKRRLNIACAIVHKPKLIIMDEPTVGIDPQSRNHILNSVRELNKNGSTLIYTTHYMEEVEAICTRVGIIDRGKLIAEGNLEELKEIITDEECLILRLSDAEDLNKEAIEKVQDVLRVETKGETIAVYSKKNSKNLNLIISNISDLGHSIKYIKSEKPDLEKVFLTLTGRKLRD